MKRLKWFVAALALGVPALTQALETVSQTLTLGPHATDWTTNSLLVPNADMLYSPMEFQKFDSSLGVLAGVQLEVQGSFTATMRIFNSGNHTLESAEVSVDMLIDIGNDGSAESNMTMSDALGSPPLPISLTQPGPFMVDATVSGSVSDIITISDAAQLAQYVNGGGPLGTFQVGCGSTSAHIANIQPTDGLALFTHTADSSCQVKVTYLYVTGGNLPVPGSLLLMLSGGLWYRRRYRMR